MSVETEHEKESQMVRVPECLKALSADFVMGSCIHQNNDEEHEVAGDTTRLVVVNCNGCLRPNLYIT